ncbi:putative RING zinc finger domain superfamily protein [Panicum miliaceum]|uniref:RING zinc finger domain superfamily protein n=1 Tax=Panicum miliaceum TaxID=4540 RepID=A0A3L6QCI2_PANMI|nr:putative RING zinc finger domain superfamily protein [Panicum miliaceum]
MSPRYAHVDGPDGGYSRCISISDIALPCPGVALRLNTIIDCRPGADRMPPVTIDFVKSMPPAAQLAGRFECDSGDFILFSQLRRVAEMVAAAGLPPECAPSVNDFRHQHLLQGGGDLSVEACAPGSLAADEAEAEGEGEEVPPGAVTGECAICYAEYVVGAATSVTPPCGHTFHRRCLDRWTSVRQSCPYCRAPVPVVYDYCWSGEEEEEEDGDTEDYGDEDPSADDDAVSGSHQPS